MVHIYYWFIPPVTIESNSLARPVRSDWTSLSAFVPGFLQPFCGGHRKKKLGDNSLNSTLLYTPQISAAKGFITVLQWHHSIMWSTIIYLDRHWSDAKLARARPHTLKDKELHSVSLFGILIICLLLRCSLFIALLSHLMLTLFIFKRREEKLKIKHFEKDIKLEMHLTKPTHTSTAGNPLQRADIRIFFSIYSP